MAPGPFGVLRARGQTILPAQPSLDVPEWFSVCAHGVVGSGLLFGGRAYHQKLRNLLLELSSPLKIRQCQQKYLRERTQMEG